MFVLSAAADAVAGSRVLRPSGGDQGGPAQEAVSAPMLLMTPGPLSTQPAVRAAMGHDYGSRTPAFAQVKP